LNNAILTTVSSIFATVVAVLFAWLVGKGLDWFRRRPRG